MLLVTCADKNIKAMITLHATGARRYNSPIHGLPVPHFAQQRPVRLRPSVADPIEVPAVKAVALPVIAEVVARHIHHVHVWILAGHIPGAQSHKRIMIDPV